MKLFLFQTLAGVVFLLISCQQTDKNRVESQVSASYPLVLSTWANIEANDKAYEFLLQRSDPVEAVVQGIMVTEADESDSSVGIGGLPDETGRVTLDACIMNSSGDAGSVTFLDSILHPIAVARLVMDSLDHVMLSGEGALSFARQHGFETVDLLTGTAREAWERWLDSQKKGKPGNHDTIGMLVMDKDGNISGGCSTSGMAFKKRGRVGDSPIIGAGLYLDNAVGAATATGKGEEVMKSLGSFLIVELMRQGMTPQQACEEAIKRIANKYERPDFQVAYIAINKRGEIGAFSLEKGFEYALSRNGQTIVNKSLSHY